MLKQILKFSWMVALLGLTFFTACEQENALDEANIESYLDEAIYHMEQEGSFGRLGCYELVFPVTILFPDSTEAKVKDYEALVKALSDWKAANPEAKRKTHPKIKLPFSVIAEGGEIIEVDSVKELMDLRHSCPGDFGKHGPKGHKGKGAPCFEFVFPVTVSFADSTSVKIESQEALKEAVHKWHTANPTLKARPKIEFPFKVKLKDGSTLVINNKDELMNLRKNCKP
jgi:hypothetical protein